MPMRVDDLKKYENYEEEEIRIAKFLEQHRGFAYTYEELHGELHKRLDYEPDEKGSYLTLKNIGKLSLNIVGLYAFSQILRNMAKEGKIKMKMAKGEEYFYIE